MRVKIRGGTADHGDPSPCLTCRYATIVKGASLRDEIVECAQLAYGRNRIECAVNTCTEYSDRRQPLLRAMEEIAWVLRSDPKKNQVGFVRRAELTRRERARCGSSGRRVAAGSFVSYLAPPSASADCCSPYACGRWRSRS